MGETGIQTRAQFLLPGPVLLGAALQLPRHQPHLLLVLWQAWPRTASRRVQGSPGHSAKASHLPAFPTGPAAARCSRSEGNGGFRPTARACQPPRPAGLGNAPVTGPSLGAQLSTQPTMSSEQWCAEGRRPSQSGAPKWDTSERLNDTS